MEKAGAYGIINHEKVVDAGKNHFVILKADGSVWGWGDNMFGQMGQTVLFQMQLWTNSYKKSRRNRMLNIKAIAAGGYHTVALEQNGMCGRGGETRLDNWHNR